MTFTIRAAATDEEWQEAMAVVHRVYVGEGHSSAERSAELFRREVLEPEGEALIAVNGAGSVLGATIFLHERSPLQQVALSGEREFRLLAVRPEARGTGVGAALVQACIDRARAARATGLVLWTRPSMQAAQRLYER